MSKTILVNGSHLTLIAKPRNGVPGGSVGDLVLECKNWSMMPFQLDVMKHNSSDAHVAWCGFAQGMTGSMPLHVGRRPLIAWPIKANIISTKVGEWKPIAPGGSTLEAEVTVGNSPHAKTVKPHDDVRVK